MRPCLRFEKNRGKIVFLHVVFFLGVKHPLKKCTNWNQVIIYQKFIKRRQTFSSKHIFFSLEFQHVSSINCRGCGRIYVLKKNRGKIVFLHVGFFPRCKTPPKKLHKLKSSHNISEIYQKKTDFFIKTYFLALNFNLSAR